MLLVGHALEIDIATNKVLLDWVSIDHVGLDESYQPLPSARQAIAYDFFHINSIAEAPDGNLLISGRNTWTVYKVHRTTGEIIWRLNGKRSDFDVPEDGGLLLAAPRARARGIGAHDLRQRRHQRPRVAGDAAATSTRTEAGLAQAGVPAPGEVPGLDARQRAGPARRQRVRRLGRAAVLLASSQPDGELLVDGQFESETRSYRTFLTDWTGRPTDKPAVVARANTGGGFLVYVSWNGATEIDHWTVLAGSDPASLQPVASQAWSGFETTIVVNSNGPLFAVAAIDRDGNELGRSEVV